MARKQNVKVFEAVDPDDPEEELSQIEIEGYALTDINDVRLFPDVGAEIETDEGDFILFPNQKSAGEAAREYWEDMARNDPSEFTAMVGEETLVSWGLGQPAGPGTNKVRNLEEWLDLWLLTPEEYFAGYDGEELDVQRVTRPVVGEIGFKPTVAYRTN